MTIGTVVPETQLIGAPAEPAPGALIASGVVGVVDVPVPGCC